MSLRSASRTTGTTQAVGRVGGEADVEVLACTMRLAPSGVERGVEARELLQRLDAGAHDEGERRELDARGLRLVLEAGAQLLELGDVGLVELRDVRDVDPAGMQARPGDALDARQRLESRSGRTARSRPPAPPAAPPPRAAAAPRRGAPPPPSETLLTNALTSSCVMRPLKPWPATWARFDAELAREPAHRGPGMGAREPRLVDGREVLAVRGRHAQLRQRYALAAGALRRRRGRGRRCRGCLRWRCRARRGRRAGCGRSGRRRSSSRRRRRRCGRGARAVGPERRDQVAAVERPALGDVDLLDDAAGGRRHVHRRLVRSPA